MQITVYIEGQIFPGIKTEENARDVRENLAVMLGSELPTFALELEDGSALVLGPGAMTRAAFHIRSLPLDKPDKNARIKKALDVELKKTRKQAHAVRI